MPNPANPSIIFEDENLLVLNKPANLIVHEGSGHQEHTLVDFLKDYLGNSKLDRQGLVHRLDKDTSGVILVAKTIAWFDFLKEAFKAHQITKHYTLLVTGKLAPKSGAINIAIDRDMVDRTKYRPAKKGREATTNYEVVSYHPGFTLVDAQPKTGRTHQLRVHFSAIGHPIAGDILYGTKAQGLPRQFLHASSIEFTGPEGDKHHYVAELPDDLVSFLATL